MFPLIALVAGITLVLYFLILYPSSKSKLHEPHVVASRVAYIGHIYGLARHQALYFDKLCSLPIFSISIFNYKIHAITDPALISSVHRSHRVSFDPIIVDIAVSIIGDSPKILKLMHDTNPGEPNRYLADTYLAMHESLVPGSSLWEMNARVLSKISNIVNVIGNNFEERSLWFWLRDSFTEATTEALFGIYHPLKDLGMIQALWDFDSSQLSLMLLPKALTYLSSSLRRIIAGHRRLQAEFRQFYSDPTKCEHSSVSSLVRSRTKVNAAYGVPMDEIGNSALSLLFVSTTNAIPTLYWAIIYIFSNLALVSELRSHIENSGVVTFLGTHEGKRRLEIDHTKFNERCPLLVAAYNETMRLTNVQPGTRVVLEDFILGGCPDDEKTSTEGYLLKKGSLIMTPARTVHLSRDIWGDDAEVFRPSRWLSLNKKQKRAFIPFGGGKHLCPGRDFAFAEIVGALAVLLIGFDIVGEDGRVVRLPNGMETKFGVVGPNEEGKALKIKVKRRTGWEDTIWSFRAGG